ncbi:MULTISPECIES: terminase small subunit [Apilactobacillus]|uniref:terminase small subunit n=1 Tax=Apilactobacillus TaxID=2767877 RepID=UPI000D022191|nr:MULTISPECIES: terminase small subunit [Apilactobacillus]TPR40418.1 terminase small subunit [Apilactobacillus micheneri]
MARPKTKPKKRLPVDIRNLAHKLTARQLKFADYYIEYSNGTKAAIAAGYSKATAYAIACENLKKPKIREYVDARNDFISSQKVADQTEINERLTAIARNEVTDTVATGGKIYNDAPIAVKDQISALKLLGKTRGMFTDKVQTELSGSIDFSQLKDVSDNTLEKYADNDESDNKFDVNKDYPDA